MIKVEKSKLVEGLRKVSNAISKNTTLEILNGVLIEAENNNLSITATDLNIAITTHIPCQTEMFKETYVVDAKLFTNIISKMPEENIEITLKEKAIEIKSGNSKFNINILGQAEEYPSLNTLTEIKDITKMTLKADTFKEIVKRTYPFVREDHVRPELNGIKFEISNKILKTVSLDGYRLSYFVSEIDDEIDGEIIIPAKVLENSVKAISGENVIISFNKEINKCIKIESEDAIIYSRTLEGKFLDFKSLLQVENNTTIVKANREKLKEAIDRVLIIAKAEKNIPVILKINNNQLKIIAKTDNSNIKEVLDIKTEGENNVIAFNPLFVQQALSVMENEEIEFRIKNKTSPAFILDGDNYIHLLLPIRIENIENIDPDEDEVITEEKAAS